MVGELLSIAVEHRLQEVNWYGGVDPRSQPRVNSCTLGD